MALVVIASAKGAPGVTTLTVALAALTPGAIAADLDPDGGDLALRYRREDGSPLDPQLGLLSLAASLRRDQTEPATQTGPVVEHLQVASGGLELLLGVTGPDQAVGLGPLWSPLGRALADTDRTVFADCGRIGPASPAMPVLMQADAVILLARAEVEELSHLRERLRFLTATLPGRYNGPAQVGVILVARERDRAAGPRTEQLLRSSGLAVPVLGTVAEDARGAAQVRGLHGGRAGRTTLVRSVRSLLPAVITLVGYVPAAVRPGGVAPAEPSPAPPAPPPPPAPPAPSLRTMPPNRPVPPPPVGVALGGAYSSPPRLLPPRPELMPLSVAPEAEPPEPLPFPAPAAGVISPYHAPPEDDHEALLPDEHQAEDGHPVPAEEVYPAGPEDDGPEFDVVETPDVVLAPPTSENHETDQAHPGHEIGETPASSAADPGDENQSDAATTENGWPGPGAGTTGDGPPTVLQNWGH
jgi:hypothetical protein